MNQLFCTLLSSRDHSLWKCRPTALKPTSEIKFQFQNTKRWQYNHYTWCEGNTVI